MTFSLRVLLLVAVGVCGPLVMRAEASCGLDACPIPKWGHKQKTTRFSWRLSEEVRFTTFSFQGAEGHYVESIARAEYHPSQGLQVGALLPVVALFSDGRDSHGLGNAVGYAELGRPIAGSTGVRIGAQLEAPTGTGEGLAADHVELLSYVGLTIESHRVRFRSELGLRLSLGDSHGHDEDDQVGTALLVNPHEDREFVYQAIADVEATKRLRSGLLLRGQQVWGNAEHRSFLTAGGQLTWSPTERIALTTNIELPVIRPARFDIRTSVQISAGF